MTKLKILALSDTHLEFPNVSALPDADVFLHAGDWTNLGYRHSKAEFEQFLNFLEAVKNRYPHVLALHGNHDLGIDNSRWQQWGVIPLDGTTWRHECGISFHGVALTPAYDKPEMMMVWQHMTMDEAQEEAAWEFEPVDVVVSHGPPFGYLDRLYGGKRIGSRYAVSYIRQHQPKFFICGHIHEAAGEIMLHNTRIINTAQKVRILEV
jgi:Icc-related predicted phosphoesterase